MKSILLYTLLIALPIMAPAATGPWHIAQTGSGDYVGQDETPLLKAIAHARTAGGGDIIIQPGVYHIHKSIARGNILVLPADNKTRAENHFINTGSHNLLEENRVVSADVLEHSNK